MSAENEAMLVSHVCAPEVGKPAQEALLASRSHSCDGALDSACNRTVAGRDWLHQYLEACGHFNLGRVNSRKEFESFRFGNGGRLISNRRYRIPVVLKGRSLFLWVSVVDCPSLGLLLGKDFATDLGIGLDFGAQRWSSKLLNLYEDPISEMRVGHFKVSLLDPASAWREPRVLTKLEVVEYDHIDRARTWLADPSCKALSAKLKDHCLKLTRDANLMVGRAKVILDTGSSMGRRPVFRIYSEIIFGIRFVGFVMFCNFLFENLKKHVFATFAWFCTTFIKNVV